MSLKSLFWVYAAQPYTDSAVTILHTNRLTNMCQHPSPRLISCCIVPHVSAGPDTTLETHWFKVPNAVIIIIITGQHALPLCLPRPTTVEAVPRVSLSKHKLMFELSPHVSFGTWNVIHSCNWCQLLSHLLLVSSVYSLFFVVSVSFYLLRPVHVYLVRSLHLSCSLN